MVKPDKAVIDNTVYIAAVTLILAVLMHAVFLIAGHWSLSVLWGSLLGCAAAVLNFFTMGLFVQQAVQKEEKEARNLVKLSQTVRFMGVLVVAVIGVAVPWFHSVAVVVPLLFPRVAIALYPLTHRGEDETP
ncbi:MAG: ATP synthase subunit I [Clostridia bacterium]|nr:ATP synthase subunit I [Clostridia bacterium]